MGGVKQFFKEIWGVIRKKNPAKERSREAFKPSDELGGKELPEWHLYKLFEGETYSDHLNRFHWTHFFFSNKLLKPVLRLLKTFFDDKLVDEKDLPDVPHNDLIKLFGESFEEAIRLWCVVFRRLQKNKDELGDWSFWEEQCKNGGAAKDLRIIKKLGMTKVVEDSVYREFLIILGLVWANKQFEYAGEHGGEIHHLFFPNTKYANDELAYQYYKLYEVIRQVPRVKNKKVEEEKGFQVEPVHITKEGEASFNRKLEKAVKKQGMEEDVNGKEG